MMDTTGKFTSAALLDDLTGLYNRRYFYLRLDEEIKRSSRYGRPFCLLLMDLDNFKLINDSFGHLKGDKVLAEFARLLKESVRETDIACRYGGDEFALILPETDRKSSLKVAKKIMEALKKTYFGDDMPLRLSISIGISSYPEDGSTPEELFNASDHALYFAKREGGNRIKLVEKREMTSQETGLYLSPKFTGRDAELESLKKFFVKTLQRKTTTVVISGEAGVGKTRLAREFLKVASLLGAEILKGKCYDFTKDIPYQPIKEALATFSEIDPLEIYSIIDEMPVLIRSEVLKILPFLDITRLKLSSEHIKTGREPDDKWRLFGGIKELFEGLERKRPLVLFFDDIHWADEASLELVSFLARSIENKRILFLLAFREGEREKNPIRSFLNSFTKENNYHEIHLKRLKEEDVSRMLKSILGFNAPAELVEYLYSETEGNPFFIVEYVRRMADEGTISEIKKGSFRVDTIKKTIPPGIKDIILARIAPLRDITKRILRIASVIGEEIDFNVLLAVSGINEGFLFDVLDELLKLKILREDLKLGTEVYSFTHGKIRDVVYEDMPHSLRKTLHRKVGNTLEEITADVEQIAEELAHHFLQAREEEKALKYLLMSARKAEKLYAFENALSHYEKALSLIPPSRKERLDIYMNMIPLLHILGKRKRENSVLEKAFALVGEKDERYRELLRHRIKYLISLSNYKEAKELCESLLNLEKRAGKSPQYAETLMLLGKIHYLQAYYDTALEAFEEAAGIWEELGDNSSYAKALTQIARILNKRGQSRKSTEYLSRAFEVLKKAGDRRGMAEIYCEQGIIHLELSEFEKSREFFEKAHKLYTEIGDKEGEARALHLEGNSILSISEYEKALSKFEKALEIRKAIDDKRGMAASLANMGLIYQSTGNAEKAIEYYRSAAAIAEEIGDRDSLQVILNNMGTIYLNESNLKEARRTLNKALKIAREIKDKSMESTVLINLGNIAWQKGKLDEAERAFLDALKVKSSLHDRESVGLVNTNLSILYLERGKFKESLSRIKRSIKMQREIGCKNSYVTSLYTYYQILKEMGKYRLAASKVTEALRISKEIGALDEEILGYIFAAEANLFLGNTEVAREYLQEAEKQAEALKNPVILVSLCETKSHFYRELKRTERALNEIKKALKLAKKYELATDIPYILKSMAEIEYLAGDREKASVHLKKCMDLCEKYGMYFLLLKGLAFAQEAELVPEKAEEIRERVEALSESILKGLSEKDRESILRTMVPATL
ncbi:MAG: hypothetical protein DRQ04_03330 [Candidatus Hydrothermota bacterium]|nr:MAG: hypothetical protein DRQ04_03330 [Candidatus Hydrothermae bacterium]